MKSYPLDIESVGEDTYIVMSRGHHDLELFMAEAVKERPRWSLGGPRHVWCKTTPGRGTYDSFYHFVPEGTRGAWPATYCHEFGEGYQRYNERSCEQCRGEGRVGGPAPDQGGGKSCKSCGGTGIEAQP